MRKILLGTTAVVGAALIGATSAQAQTAPTVRVGGYFDFGTAFVDDSLEVAGGDYNTISMYSDLEVVVTVRGKTANGLSYGADIELQTDAGGAGSTTLNTDEAWGFISSPTLGTLQFGDNDSAANQLAVSAPSLHQSSPSGAWIDFAINGQYINSSINDGNDSTKIIYLSPQFFGFDFGLSYAPNAGEGESQFFGNGALRRDQTANPSATGNIQNEISAGIRYRGSFGNIGVAAGFGFMTGDAPTGSGLEDPTAYQVGATVTGYGLTVGAHYLWGQYLAPSFGRGALARGLDDSTTLNFGAVYRMGAFAVNAFYAIGTQDLGPVEREQTAWGLGATYALAPGMELWATYNNVDDEDFTAAGADRDMNIFALGVRLAF
ncbi:porin [Falsiroseomonas sp.]|uniref:porin n=1 Tax=Falsiroseomonas sp. TaxID=2870721 RepID=UPI003568167C